MARPPTEPDARRSSLRIERELEDDRVRLRLEGELDLATIGALQEAIEALPESTPAILIDLGRVVFIDSSGVRMLLQARRRCDTLAQRLLLSRGPEQVERVLRLTGLDRHFEIVAEPGAVPQA